MAKACMIDKEIWEVIAIMDRVHRGELSPADAEAWAEQKGRPPFVNPAYSSTHVFNAPYWPFFLAAAWILFREAGAALKAFERHRVWGKALWLNEPWNQAVQELHAPLSTGRLVALGVEPSSNQRVEIPKVKWIDFWWDRSGKADFPVLRGNRDAAYHDVLLPAENVREIWPLHQGGIRKALSSAAQEAECRRKLIKLMRAHPNEPVSKAKLKIDYSTLSERAFDRAFTAASLEAQTPAWRSSGARRKSPRA